MSEEQRRAGLVEVIEMGEELFEMVLAGYRPPLTAVEQGVGDETERTRLEMAAGDVGDLRAAAETFFRVLRGLAAGKDDARG